MIAKLSGKSTIAAAAAAYLEAMAERHIPLNTWKAYGVDLRALERCWGDLPLAQLQVAQLESFLQAGTYQASTRQRRYANLAGFFRWLARHDVLARNPMDRLERLPTPERQPRPLAPARVRALLARIPRKALRDRTLFTLVYETGVRIGEALGLQVEDVDLRPDDEQLRVLGKGHRWRTIPLTAAPETLRLLSRHLRQSGLRSGAVFRAQAQGGGGRQAMDYTTARRAWLRYCQAVELTATMHQLRHTRATELVAAGVPLTTVRKLLGHRSLQSTMLYTEVSQEVMKRDLLAFLRSQKGRT